VAVLVLATVNSTLHEEWMVDELRTAGFDVGFCRVGAASQHTVLGKVDGTRLDGDGKPQPKVVRSRDSRGDPVAYYAPLREHAQVEEFLRRAEACRSGRKQTT